MGERLHRYRDLRADGLSRDAIEHCLRTGALARVSRGIYVEGNVDDLAALRALFVRMPEGVLLSHQSAADIFGFGVLANDAIHVIVPVGLPRPEIDGVVAHESVLPIKEPWLVGGVPCTPPARVAVDLARTQRRLDGIAVLDAALRTEICTPDDLARELESHGGLRGVCQARQLVPLADGRAECPQESHMRLVIVDGGLPVPEPQVWIYDDRGRGFFRVDLAYRKKRVGLEYDGASHMERERLRADRYRMNWLAAHGWTMRYFTDRDLYREPDGLVATVRDTLR